MTLPHSQGKKWRMMEYQEVKPRLSPKNYNVLLSVIHSTEALNYHNCSIKTAFDNELLLRLGPLFGRIFSASPPPKLFGLQRHWGGGAFSWGVEGRQGRKWHGQGSGLPTVLHWHQQKSQMQRPCACWWLCRASHIRRPPGHTAGRAFSNTTHRTCWGSAPQTISSFV